MAMVLVLGGGPKSRPYTSKSSGRRGSSGSADWLLFGGAETPWATAILEWIAFEIETNHHIYIYMYS